MPYRVEIPNRIAKEILKFPRDDRERIIAAVEALEGNPRPRGTRKLEADTYRIRVGAYRVIYSVYDQEQRVLIDKVVRRRERTYR